MIPPNQGPSLSQDSSLNRTPRENCYISRYKGPNQILQDVLDRAWNLISMVKISNPIDETVTHDSLYKYAMRNNFEKSHLGKILISPNW